MCAPKGAGSALESILKAHEAQAHRSSELKEASVSYFSQRTPFGGKGPQELQPSAIPKDFRMLSVPFLWQQVVLNRAMSSWEDNTGMVPVPRSKNQARANCTTPGQQNPFTKLRKNQAFLKTSFKNAKWQWSWSFVTCNNACLSQEKRVEERHPWSKQLAAAGRCRIYSLLSWPRSSGQSKSGSYYIIAKLTEDWHTNRKSVYWCTQ